MRRTLGVLSLLLVLTACGEERSDSGGPGDGAGTDPATTSPTPTPTPSATPAPTPTDAPASGLVTILHETAAGGADAVGAPAVRIDAGDGLREFTSLLDGAGLVRQVETTAAGIRLRGGQALYAAVIAVGCDVPPSASVTVSGGEVTVTPAKVPAPMRECFAPVTSVAIVTAPAL